MKTLQAFGLIVGLGLVLNVAIQVSSQHLSCDPDEDRQDPDCPPPEGPGVNSTYFPVPYDCRKFFECSNGVAKCLVCAPGTVWDQAQETCDHEDYTECVIVTTTTRSPPTTPTTTTPTTTTPTTTTPTTTTPTTTTPTTTTPTTTTPTTTTPTTTTPTTTTPTTTTPTTTTPTTTTPTTTTPTTTTTEATTTPRPWNLCPIDDPMEPPGTCPDWEPMPTYFPYPYNCKKYFQCSNGLAICMQCANGTVWNQGLEVCDTEDLFPCVIVTTTLNPAAVQEENGIVRFFKKLQFF